jgi:hypothetical protein
MHGDGVIGVYLVGAAPLFWEMVRFSASDAGFMAEPTERGEIEHDVLWQIKVAQETFNRERIQLLTAGTEHSNATKKHCSRRAISTLRTPNNPRRKRCNGLGIATFCSWKRPSWLSTA